MMPGGLTKAKPATPEVQEIADEVSDATHGKVWSKILVPRLALGDVGERENQNTGKCVVLFRLFYN